MAKDSHSTAPSSVGVPVDAMALDAEILADGFFELDPIAFGDVTIEPKVGRNALWFFVGGRLALRTAWSPGGGLKVKRAGDLSFEAMTSLGQFHVELVIEPDDRLLRATTRFTPAIDLLVPHWPRDLYPLDPTGRPLRSEGRVEAAQRGVNVGLVFFTLREPDFGTVLYLQNLTALNDWHRAAGTAPDGVVGGQWPELGYQPKPFTEAALPAGEPLIQSDVLLCWNPQVPHDDQDEGAHFLDLLARSYRRLEKPATRFRDWPVRADLTLRHLTRSPKAHVRHYGHLYLHPYTDAEYPDCMVQLSVGQSVHEYARWRGRPIALEAALLSGMRKFHDPDLQTLRRYLPNVGEDKDADEVDSWYLYHPLVNLGRLAVDGDEASRSLFFDCLDYAIEVARRFKYDWPIKFNVKTRKVIKATRTPGGPGQSDVGGIYAYVMVLAFDLTGEKRYLREAEKALRALDGWRFEMLYQANLSAWGATAAVRLWRATGEAWFLGQCQVLLAGFFHNCLIWESELKAAAHYSNFLGASCLHDGPYMALYECFESFAAFEELLVRGGDGLPDAVRLLLTEYRKYALHRAWFYFPDALPADVFPSGDEVRNGHIDRKLSFPVEDLYGDGQPPGQVGQEIYGCGAPFTFATRAFHDVPGAPFRLFAAYPVRNLVRSGTTVSFEVDGAKGYGCEVRLLPRGRTPLQAVKVCGEARKPQDGAVVFEARAGEPIDLDWS
ncbi:MAG: hypothetical protein V4466_02885 [Pseudomonadota bacterium]